MANNYKISPDGLITRLNEDGSVTMLAKVDENGKINGPDGKSLQKTVVKTRTQTKTVTRYVDVVPGWSVAVMILLAIVAIGGVISCCDSKDELESAYDELNDVRYDADSKLTKMKSAQSVAASTHPILIRNIEIANVYKDGEIDVDYGKSISSWRTMYLKPKLTYWGLTSGTVRLGVRLYDPYGNMSQGDSSPKGFTYYSDVYVGEGLNECVLTGWGNDRKGHWSSGWHYIEIYYEGRILSKEWFRIR